jgi:putative tryptophan/tyrosine transport system substrate-binding protein
MQFDQWKRRAFITLLGGAAAAWPIAARAQQRMRRIGVLMGFAENDEVWQSYLASFKRGLEEFGWVEGRNLRIYYRWAGEDAERTRITAEELVALAPDLLFVTTNPALSAVMQATRTIPIVFTWVSDSVGSGFVKSLAHPGGNVTGFHNFEPSMGGKWLEVLREAAPDLRRAAVLYVPEVAANIALLHAAETASSALGMMVIPAAVRSTTDIEQVLTAFAREPNGGLVVTPSPLTGTRRDVIIAMAARLHLPAIYSFGFYSASGGLLSYGIDQLESVRGAASYVDRILHGANPGELPVQLPTKFRLVINLNTAKALGLTIPESFLLRADEVIE